MKMTNFSNTGAGGPNAASGTPGTFRAGMPSGASAGSTGPAGLRPTAPSNNAARTRPINLGIDHGYYAIKTRHCSFQTGLAEYANEPYTLQNTLEYGGRFYICGTGRQPVLRDKTANENYYLLTLAAIARELRWRKAPNRAAVRLAVGLPLTGFGRGKKPFRAYLLRDLRPVCFKFEGQSYEITIEDVRVYPQGYSALSVHPDLLGEPSVLLMDIGGWTVDIMRIDNKLPNAATCRSLELGVIRCVDEALEQVRRALGLSLTDAQVESVLRGAPCSLDDRAREIVERAGRQYVDTLLSAAMEAGFDVGAMPAILLGGGAAVIKRHAGPAEALFRPVYLLDEKVNAEGFERFLEQLSGGDGGA